MTPKERRYTAHLASIYGLRMLGMFIILPVFALYAKSLPGGDNLFLVGVTLGAYGLTQAILQIPFGWASDKFGRTKIILWGLVVFAIGSFVAAAAPAIGNFVSRWCTHPTTMYWLLLGRMLQGAGAISGCLIALLADLTRFSVRTKSMAAIGMTIGSTFAISMIFAPTLTHYIGVPGIFIMTGILTIVAFLDIKFFLSDIPSQPPAQAEGAAPISFWKSFGAVMTNPSLLRLNIGIFILHAVLMSLFVQIPFDLKAAGLPPNHHWFVYLPVMVFSLALLMPTMKFMDNPKRGRIIFLAAVTVLLIGHIVLALSHRNLVFLTLGLLLFFIGFNQLEAALPARVSKEAPDALKGSATGIYSSLQFLGTFLGAAIGGAIIQHWKVLGDTAKGEDVMFWTCAAACFVWWLIVLFEPKQKTK